VSPRKTQIVLNGKTYDIAPGKKVVAHPSTANLHPANVKHQSAPAPIKALSKINGPKSIDGVVGKSKINHRVQKTSSRDFSHHTNDKMRLSKSANRSVHHAKHRQVQKSKILMRTSVHTPKSTDSAVMIASEDSLVLPDQQARLERAKKVAKSPVITRFPAVYQTANEFSQPSHVVVEPSPVDNKTLAINQPAKKLESSHVKPKTQQESVFEKAMVNSNSHQGKPHKIHHRTPKIKRRRNLKLATGILSALLLTGFILYQNVPNFSMRIASNKAGFDASLPAYSPSGYSMSGPVVYSPGKVTVNFSSNTDDRNYTISQQVSNWNSQALVDNYLSSVNSDYQSYQEKGKTIYIYDNGSATWVSGGVWYNLQGGTELNTNQLLKIAASI